MAQDIKKLPQTFTDYMRLWFKGITEPTAAFLLKIGVTPNMITMLGLLLNVAAGFMVARGEIVLGGILAMVGGPLDALDGTMARMRGEASDFGAFVDSVTDRYSELFVLGGLSYYFLGQNDWLSVMVCYAAAAGSVLVSYVKARADSLKFDANTGILTRMERYMVIGPLLILNQPLWVIWIIAVLGNITALQRIWRVRRDARSKAASAKE